MYVIENYPSKRKFLDDVKRLKQLREQESSANEPEIGRLEARLQVWTPGPFGATQNGRTTIEGPHAPKPHKWYSAVTVRDGIVIQAS